MLSSRKISELLKIQWIPTLINCHGITTTLSNHKYEQRQVKMMKKIMGGREKGKKRWMISQDLPKMENVSKLSSVKGQGKESNRRVTVLNKLFMKNITDLMATDNFAEEISGFGLQVTQVRVSPDFQGVNVYWLAKGDKNDSVIEQTLRMMSGALRHELSQLRLMGEVPRIQFVKDRFFSKAVEVDILLQRADFGDDFTPTDPTFLMKSTLELEMSLSEEMKSQIIELEESCVDDYIEEEIPEMRNDVLGIDHSEIMKRITKNIDKSKLAWEKYEEQSTTIASMEVPVTLSEAQDAISKLNKEAEMRDNFAKFLERKQFAKKDTPERKRYRNFRNYENYQDEEYKDVPDDDFIEEDVETKKTL